MTDPLLEVRDLRAVYHTERGVAEVLDRVNLTIGRGEVVGLVGESGCGKSTLGRSILGILPEPAGEIVGGSIRFDGAELLEIDPDLAGAEIRGRRITFVPQDPFGSFNPLFTVGDQLMDLMKFKSPRRARVQRRNLASRWPALLTAYDPARKKEDRAAVIDMLREVQIPSPEQVMRKYPHQLSGGQRQRVMIAMALLPEPELIVADEPTTALDVTIQAQVLRLLADLVRRRNVSVLFTTHDLGTASEICDRILVMYAGQEVEEAPTDRFFARPRHPYTTKLLEALPNEEGRLVDIPGNIPRLVDPPQGCRFHTRCERADETCRTRRPPAVLEEDAHMIRCYHPVERWAGAPEAGLHGRVAT